MSASAWWSWMSVLVLVGCGGADLADGGLADGGGDAATSFDAAMDARADGDGGGSPNVTPEAGGTVVSDDGLVTLTVPAGAVASSVHVDIRRLASSEVPADIAEGSDTSRFYALEPDGLSFLVPARVVRDLAPEELAAIDFEGAVSLPLLFTRSSDGAIEPLESPAIEIDAAAPSFRVSGDVAHFSILYPAVGGFYASSTPRQVDVEVPARWPVGVTVGSSRVSETLWNDVSWDDVLAMDDLPNPPPAILTEAECAGDGVVEVDECMPALPVDLAPSSEVVVGDGLAFDCFDPGSGAYVVRLALRVPGFRFWPRGIDILVRGDARCRPRRRPAAGAHDTVPGVDTGRFGRGGRFIFGADEGLGDLTIFFGEGTAIHRADDGTMVADHVDRSAMPIRVFDGNVVRWAAPGAPPESIVTAGDFGWANRGYVEAMRAFSMFQQLGGFGGVYTSVDVVPNASDPALADAVLVVNNTAGYLGRLIWGAFGVEEESGAVISASDIAAAGIGGRLVDFDPTTDGSTYVATTDVQLFWGRMGGPPMAFGAPRAGAGLRRVRCDGSRCVAGDVVAGEVVSFGLDATGAPDAASLVVEAVPGTVGPAVQGDLVAAASPVENRVYLFVRPPGGPAAACHVDVGPACDGPADAFFVSLAGEAAQVAVNCARNARYFVTAEGAFSCAP